MMFWYGGGWAWWQAVLTWFGMIVFWGAIAWAIYALVTSLARRPEAPRRDEEGPSATRAGRGARRILDERLAKGEIDAEEYRRLRDLLEEDREPAARSRRAS